MRRKKVIGSIVALMALCLVCIWAGCQKRENGEENNYMSDITKETSAMENESKNDVESLTETNYTYEILEQGKSIMIIEYLGNESIVCVPEKLEGIKVGYIGEGAFRGNASVKHIILPLGVVEIGNHAFEGCPQLEYIVMGNGIEKIGYDAFSFNPNLLELRFPESMTEINEVVCQNCPNLRNIYLPQSINDLSENAFIGCVNLRLVYGKSRTAENYAKKMEMVYVDLERIEREGNQVW